MSLTIRNRMSRLVSAATSSGSRRGLVRRALQIESLESRTVLAAVATDRPDYAPADTVQILASDFRPGEAIEFQVLHSDGTPNSGQGHLPWTVVDGGPNDLDHRIDGRVLTTWYVNPDDSADSTFRLTARGLTSNLLAMTTFTDAYADKLGQFANQPDAYYYTFGNLNRIISAYTEGASTPYRYFLANGPENGTLVLQITYHYIHQSANAQDFLTSDNTTETITDALRFGPLNNAFPSGFELSTCQNSQTIGIPDDPTITQDNAYFGSRNLMLCSSLPFVVTDVTAPALSSEAESKFIQLTISLGNDGDATPDEQIIDLALFFGAHLAVDADWPGPDNGAGDISGAGAHLSISGDLNGSNISTGDVTTQPSAIVPTSIAWEKRRDDTLALQGGATFLITPNPRTGADSISVTDNDVNDFDPDPGQFLFDSPLFGTYTITETAAPFGFTVDDFPSRLVTVNPSTPTPVIGTQGIVDPGNTNTSDFFNIPQSFIALDKVTIDGTTTGDGLNVLAGEPITWRYTVTNPSLTSLAGVAVTDSRIGVNPIYDNGDTDSDGLLDPEETWIFIATGIAVAGAYENTGTATGTYTDTSGIPHTASASNGSSYFGADPQVAINKVTVDGTVSGDGLNILTGETIKWLYTVTNAGNVPLASVTVTDSAGGVVPVRISGDTNGNNLLDLGESWIYEASGTAITGAYTNTGSASGSFTDSAGHTATDTATDASSYLGANPQIAINKVVVDGATSGDGLTILAGEAISWRYSVTNAGNVPLSNVEIIDNVIGPVETYTGDSNGDGKLDLTETWIFTASGTALSNTRANTATAGGEFTDAGGHRRRDTESDASSYFGATPSINVDKVTVHHTTRGDNLNIVIGGTVSWEYTVTNIGNVPLSSITVTDSVSGVTPAYVSGDTNTNGKLDLTEAWLFTASGIATKGAYSNIGTASGAFTDDAGHTRSVTDTDTSAYFGADIQINIDKVTVDDTTAGDGLFVLSNEEIAWRYTVTNPGNVPLSNITVTDSQSGVVPAYQSGDTNSDSKLDIGEAWIFSAVGTSVIGPYSNTGTATGLFQDAAGPHTTSDSDGSSYFGADPQILIIKSTQDGSAPGADGLNILIGESISWHYEVTSIGNVPLSNVSVIDSATGVSPSYVSGDTNSNGKLDLTETWIYSATGTAVAGLYTNTGTAKGSFTDDDGSTREVLDNDTSSYFGADPQIAIAKVTVDGTAVADGLNILTGETIKWRYVITNVGNISLSSVTVSDSASGIAPARVSGDTNSNNVLDLGETWTYEASGTAITGNYSNTGTASGTFTDSAGHARTDTASDSSNYFGANPQIAISKVVVDGATSGDGLNILTGESISWKYTVTNVGNAPLSNIQVNDSNLGAITSYTGDANSDGKLDLTETWIFTRAGTAVPGTVSNSASARGDFTDSAGHIRSDVENDTSSYFGANPQININKITLYDSASGDGLNVLAGQTVSWQYSVTNTGNVPLAAITVSDSVAGVTPTYLSGDANTDGKLDLTETWIYRASGTAIAGDYSNTGTATGSYTDSALHARTVSATDTSAYRGAVLDININKVTYYGTQAGDGLAILAGSSIGWRYTVTNAGNVPLSNIVVSDSVAGVTLAYDGGDTNSNGMLDLTETWVFHANGTAGIGNYSNIGTATGNYRDSANHLHSDTATDSSSYFGANPLINVVKVTSDNTTSGDGLNILIGEAIKWNYTVTNLGNVPLAALTVTDSSSGVTPVYVSGDTNTDGKLDLTETWLYQASGVAVTGNYANTGTANGSYTDSNSTTRVATDTDTSSYYGADPQIAITKVTVDGTAQSDGLNILTGEAIKWRYVVTNVGNIPLASVTVTDSASGVSPVRISGDTNSNNLLDLGELWLYEASGTSITGNYSNTGTATGSFTDSAGHVRTDTATDTSSYFGANPQIAISKVVVDGTSSGDGRNILVGEAIAWRYTVTNVGNVPLSRVSVNDSTLGAITTYSGDTNSDGKLDLTEVWIFTRSGTAVPGTVANLGSASGEYTDSAGHTRIDTETDASSYFGANPQIKLDKVTIHDTASGDGLNILSGENVSWQYSLTNIGNVPLSSISVSDSVAGVSPAYISGDTNTDGKLDLTETWIYRASGTAITGDYTNTGTASGTYTDSAPHARTVSATDSSAYRGAVVDININKVTYYGTQSGDGLAILAGGSIGWRYSVTNAGNVPLSNIVVSDSVAGVTPTYDSGDTNSNGMLDLTETWLFNATGTATIGNYSNIGTATGSYRDSANHLHSDTATDGSSYFGANPLINVVKVTSDAATSGDGLNILVGEAIKWQYTVTNLGNVPLSSITVTDSSSGVTPTYLSGDTNTNGKLDLTEAWIYQASGTAISGNYFNTGTASGSYTDVDSKVRLTTDTDISNYFGANPQVVIDKVTQYNSTSGDGLTIPVGGALSWRYTVLNTGNAAITSVTVVDNNGTPANTTDDFSPTYVSGDTNSNNILDTGEIWIYTKSSTSLAGTYSNTARVQGLYVDSAGHTQSPNASDSSSYFGGTAAISLDKVTNDPASAPAISGDAIYVLTGESISWTYTLKNLGNLPVENISIVDDQGVVPLYQSGDTNSDNKLDTTETWLYKVNGVAVTGPYRNQATVTGIVKQTGGDVSVSAVDQSSYYGADPQIAITKVTVDGTAQSDGLNILTGEAIKWRYVVTNVGNIPLASITVTDSASGVSPVRISGDTNSNNLLDLGELWLYEASGTSITGNYSNTSTATGSFTDSAGHVRTDNATDTSTYFGANPQIAISKVVVDGTSSGDGRNILVGETIAWRYTVTNVGNVPLSRVSVNDSTLGAITTYSGDTNSDGKLDLTEVWIFTRSGTAVPGTVANLGSASGEYTDSAGHTRIDTETDASSYFGANPQIKLDKVTIHDTASGDGLNILSGENVSWQYSLTNIGNVPLSSISVSDSVAGVSPAYISGDTNTDGKLDLTETWIYRASGIAITGDYTNTGTASGTYTDSAPHARTVSATDSSAYRGAVVDININKVTYYGTQSGDGLAILAGGSIGWRYSVTNAGNVPLSNIVVSDSVAGVTPTYDSGDTNSNGMLDLTETWLFNATGTALIGNYSNIGTATGSYRDSANHLHSDTATDGSSYFGANPLINVVKVTSDTATSGDGLNILVGEAIKWQYTVTNLGNVPLSSITVTDSSSGVTPTYLSGDTNTNGKLDLTEAWIYQASGTAISGNYFNTGTASGSYTDVDSKVRLATDTDTSSYFGADPQIAIAKVTVDGTAVADGLNILTGETIKWRYVITNVGNISLSSVTVSDSASGIAPARVSGDTNSNNVLDLGETWTYEASGTAITGNYSNTGTASGTFTDSAGHARTDTASDSSNYFGANPQIAISKVVVDGATSGDGLNILTGESISWKYTVTNVGNAPLSNIQVNDSNLGAITSYTGDANSDGKLDLTETWIFTRAGTAVPGTVSNSASARGDFTDSAGHIRSDVENDTSSYFGANPQININKITLYDSASGDGLNVLAGQTVSWQYSVTNTGNVPLAAITVSDSVAGVTPTYLSGDANTDGKLDLTETWIYRASGTAIAGDYSNTGTATGSYTDSALHSRTVSATDTSAYRGAVLDININKVTYYGTQAGDGLAILAGSSIGWRYTVTNAGNVPLSNIVVSDSVAGVTLAYDGGDTNSNAMLDLTETWVFHANGTAGIGNYSNIGTATGNYRDSANHLHSDTATDSSSYFGANPLINVVKVTSDNTTSGDGLNILIGEAMKWNYTVTNLGNVPLAALTVTDSSSGVTPVYVSGDTNTDGKLDLTETWLYQASGVAVTGNYANTGTANGSYTDSNSTTRVATDTDTSSYYGADPQIAITKVTVDGTAQSDGLNILTGEAIKWRYVVTNVGNIPLASVTVTESASGVSPVRISGDTNSNNLLDLGELWLYEASGISITGDYSNTGTATGSFTDSAGHVRTDNATDTSSYFGANPQIAISKVVVDGASSGDGRNILVGEAIAWRYTVTNVGNVPLSNVQVNDNVIGPVTSYSGDTNGDGKLDLTETWIFTSLGTALSGTRANTATAGGEFLDAGGHRRRDVEIDTSSYFGVAPGIKVDKVTVHNTARGDNLNIVVGGAVSWEYTVTNTGNMPLSSITVTDSVSGVTPAYISGDTNADGKLDLTEAWLFSTSGIAIKGAYDNIGTASGSFTDDAGHIRLATATDSSSYFGSDIQISIDKITVDGPMSGDGIYALADEDIAWKYTVTNPGNVPLYDVTVTDSQTGVVPAYQSGDADGDGKLDTTEIWIFTAVGTSVTGPYSNTGTAVGSFQDSAGLHTASAADGSNYFGADPRIRIVKTTQDGNAAGADGQNILSGETITWQYVVTNVGNVPLASVAVTDSASGVTPAYISGDTNTNGRLDLAETWTYTASATAIKGSYSNLGSASGSFTDDDGSTRVAYDNDASDYFGADPQISIEKVTVDDNQFTDGAFVLAGETIKWRYRVTNTGNVPLAGVMVTDSDTSVHPVYVSGDSNSNSLLDLGEIWGFEATGTAIVGAYSNIGTASGSYMDSLGHIGSDTAQDGSSYFGASPRIAVNKVVIDGTTSGDGLTVLSGESISWKYTVTNTGNVPLSNVRVNDLPLGPITSFTGDSNSNNLLDLGETWVYTLSGVAISGWQNNTGTAEGTYTDSAGDRVRVVASDNSSYFGATPRVLIDKVTLHGADRGDGLVIRVGDAITWEYTISNSGNVALQGVTVTDSKAGVIPIYQSGDTNGDANLDTTEQWIYRATGIAVVGSYTNTGTVQASVSDSSQHSSRVSSSDNSSYFGASPNLVIEKTTNGYAAQTAPGPYIPVGGSVTWVYSVTNTGNVPLAAVQVRDDNGTSGNLADDFEPIYISGDTNSNGRLDSAEMWIYRASGVAQLGQYENWVVASAVSPVATNPLSIFEAEMDPDVMATDVSHYFGRPNLLVIAPDKGNTSVPYVRILDSQTGAVQNSFAVYETSFYGGVRLATADMDGDGQDDIIVAPGRGRAPEIRVFKQDGTELTQFRTLAYDTGYIGGVNVAAGDVNGDGTPDLVVAPSAARTEIRVFFNNPNAADPISDAPDKSFPVFSPTYLGGADIAVADIGSFVGGVFDSQTRDMKAEIVVGSGPGMSPVVYVYDVQNAPVVVDTILPFTSSYRGGMTVETALIDGDNIPDLVLATGNTGKSVVEIWSGDTADSPDVRLSVFATFADVTTLNAPVHVAAFDRTGDGVADSVMAVQGTNGTSNQIRSFDPSGLNQVILPTLHIGPWNIASLRVGSPHQRLNSADFNGTGGANGENILPNNTGINLLTRLSEWMNPVEPMDVNADGVVTALDALSIINLIHRFSGQSAIALSGDRLTLSSGSQISPAGNGFGQANYVDVTGDNYVTALDILQIINFLNSPLASATYNGSAPLAGAPGFDMVGEGEGQGDVAEEPWLVATSPSNKRMRMAPIPALVDQALVELLKPQTPGGSDESLLEELSTRLTVSTKPGYRLQRRPGRG